MAQTSLIAYIEVRATLPMRQKAVLNAIGELGGHATMHAVAMHMLRPLHTLSGRFSELQKKELIWISSYERFGTRFRAVYSLNQPSGCHQTKFAEAAPRVTFSYGWGEGMEGGARIRSLITLPPAMTAKGERGLEPMPSLSPAPLSRKMEVKP